MAEILVNEGLEGIWKEALVAYLMYCSTIILEWMRKTTRTWVSTVNVSVEIRISYFVKTSQVTCEGVGRNYIAKWRTWGIGSKIQLFFFIWAISREWPTKGRDRFTLSIYFVRDWMNVRGDMEAVVKRKALDFLLHFIASIVNVFLYSGKSRIVLFVKFCWCNTCALFCKDNTSNILQVLMCVIPFCVNTVRNSKIKLPYTTFCYSNPKSHMFLLHRNMWLFGLI